MAAGDIALRLVMTASMGNTISAVTELGKLLGMGGMGTALAVAGVAAAGVAVALGVTAVKAAGDFQAQTLKLVTSAGELQSNLGMIRQGLLQMSVDTATSTSQLAAGMYFIESAGYRGAAALQVLGVAARGAKLENADLDTVSKALLAIMVGYHLPASQATQAMNALVAAVGNGGANLQNLADSMSAVLPIAAKLGISFPQVAGSIDTMTNHQMSARQAAMNLAHVLLALSAPSNVAVKAMQSVGLSAQQVKDALVHQGLPEALQLIEDDVGKKFPAGSVAYNTALKNILGGIMGFKVAAMLTGESLKDTEQHIAAISTAMNTNTGAVTGFAAVQQTLNFRLDQAKAAFQAALIILGTALLPIVTRLVNVVGTAVQGFMQWFMASGILQTGASILSNVLGKIIDVISSIMQWVGKNQLAMQALKYIVIGLAVAFGVILGAALLLVIVAIAAVGVAIAAIALPIMGIIWLVQHWGQIWSTVVNWVKGIWQGFTNWLGQAVAAIVGFFQMLWSKAQQIWNGLVNGIKSIVTAGFNWVVGLVQGAINTVVGWFSWLYQHNYYFADLVNFIVSAFKWVKDTATTIWKDITGFLGLEWKGIQILAQQAWGLIQRYIIQPVQGAWNWLVGTWNSITSWLRGVWNTIGNDARQLWTNFTNAITSTWSNVTGWIGQHIVNPIKQAIQNLINDAVNWGRNLIQMFINGITSMLGNLKNTLGNIASSIGQFLGFHSPPPQGPAKDSNTWMPNLIKMMVSGLNAGVPQIRAASAQAAGAIVGRPGSFALPTGNRASQNQAGDVYLDGRKVGKVLLPYMGNGIADEMRRQGGVVIH